MEAFEVCQELRGKLGLGGLRVEGYADTGRPP